MLIIIFNINRIWWRTCCYAEGATPEWIFI